MRHPAKNSTVSWLIRCLDVLLKRQWAAVRTRSGAINAPVQNPVPSMSRRPTASQARPSSTESRLLSRASCANAAVVVISVASDITIQCRKFVSLPPHTELTATYGKNGAHKEQISAISVSWAGALPHHQVRGVLAHLWPNPKARQYAQSGSPSLRQSASCTRCCQQQ